MLPVETDYVRSPARHASNVCYCCSHLQAIFNFSGGFGSIRVKWLFVFVIASVFEANHEKHTFGNKWKADLHAWVSIIPALKTQVHWKQQCCFKCEELYYSLKWKWTVELCRSPWWAVVHDSGRTESGTKLNALNRIRLSKKN